MIPARRCTSRGSHIAIWQIIPISASALHYRSGHAPGGPAGFGLDGVGDMSAGINNIFVPGGCDDNDHAYGRLVDRLKMVNKMWKTMGEGVVKERSRREKLLWNEGQAGVKSFFCS